MKPILALVLILTFFVITIDSCGKKKEKTRPDGMSSFRGRSIDSNMQPRRAYRAPNAVASPEWAPLLHPEGKTKTSSAPIISIF